MTQPISGFRRAIGHLARAVRLLHFDEIFRFNKGSHRVSDVREWQAVRGRKDYSSRGQVIAEFAVVLPILLTFVGGTIDYSLAYLTSHVVQNAAREGIRRAVVLPKEVDKATVIREAISSRIPRIGILPNPDDNTQLNVDPPLMFTDVNTGQEMIQVRVTAVHRFFLLRAIGFESVTLHRTVTMRYEWQ